MKVLAATADSATLKHFEFNRNVDSSSKDSEKPQLETLVPGPVTGPKKKQAITNICHLNDGRTAYARKTGEIGLDEDLYFTLEGEVVGLFSYYSHITELTYVIAFSSSGECCTHAVDGGAKDLLKLRVRPGLTSVVQSPKDPLTFASAGAEPLPNKFRLKLSESLDGQLEGIVEDQWNAQPPPNNILDMPEKNLVSDLTFLPDGEKLVAITSHGQIRLYDTSKAQQGEPEELVQVTKDQLKCVIADPENEGTIIIGDSRTTVSRWSTDPVKLLGHYKGVSGSTRSLSIRGPFVAMGGLDRYLRIFDVIKRQPAGKVYCGEEIWAIKLIRHDVEDEEAANEDLWDKIGTKAKRRRLAVEQENAEAASENESEADSDEGSDEGSEATSDVGSEDGSEDSEQDSEEDSEEDSDDDDSEEEDSDDGSD